MPRPLDMNVIAAQAIDMLDRLITENVQTVFVASPTPATFVADESQIHQVLLNLALNARDAMPNGGELRIEVALHDRAQGRYVCTAVHDTGTGMDGATRARVFEPFFTTKEAGKGTGLGLAIVFGIVADSGGFLEVESEPDRGSTFRVFLPFRDVDARPAVRKPAKSDPGKGETIVLVEDSTEVRTAVARILREAGYDVVEAGRPSQVLESWPMLADRIAVLITDQVMPEMSGRDLAARLRQRRPDLPIVFLTGYDPDPRDLGTERVWCVTKPITEERFLAHVREALGST
jgi:CheY-like chemotaxis protein